MDQSNANEGKLHFRLEEIMVSHFTMIDHPVISMDSGLVKLEFGFNFLFNPKDDTVICKMNLKFLLADDLKNYDNGASAVLNADIQYLFKVKNLEQFIQTSDGSQQLHLGVLAHIISVAYSTSRGIVHEKTRGYGINGLPMPILDVEDYIQEVFVKPRQTTSEPISSSQRL